MFSFESRILALLIFVTIVFNTSGRNWDMAIAIGQEIDFFIKNGTLIGETKIAKTKSLAGLAYDDTSHTLFIIDNQKYNSSIFRLNITKKNIQPQLLFNDNNGAYIVSLVFDSLSRTLFWADALKETIMKMHVPLNETIEDSKLVHNLFGRSPRSISVDFCNRHLYWGNTNTVNASIERSNLDGSNRIIIIKDNLYEPVAVSVDHATGKLYWIDDEEGIHYKIERSNLDGSYRELIFHGKHQQPVYISVDNDNIYWIDWVYNAAWTINKNKEEGDMPKQFKSFNKSHKDLNPTSIITRDNNEILNCKTAFVNKIVKPLIHDSNIFESFNNLSTSTEENEFKRFSLTHCLNNGIYSEVTSSCHCKPGFQGSNCEVSACHNYCLQGTCTINSRGLPVCQCNSIFRGLRCEHNNCYNYCLNNGVCLIKEGNPTCECKTFKGDRCELEISENLTSNQISLKPELNHVKFDDCRYKMGNSTLEQMTPITGVLNCDLLISILTAIIILLILIIILLLYYMNKLRRRPKVKKRFIVSRGLTTPLTTRPQISNAQCEITIENCCNMNICETPCFEPKLRNAASLISKKEEKKSLLVNMESNNC